MTSLVLLAVVFITSTISGVFGMAGGLILMGALAFTLPVSAAMVTHGAVQLVSNGWRAVVHAKHVRWPIIGLYGAGSVGAAALLAGCTRSLDMAEFEIDDFTTGTIRPKISVDREVRQPELMYASFEDAGFVLPEVPFKKVAPKWRRQIVVDPTGEAPGTIVVRLEERHLYWVQPGGDAVRYGVGIGRDGFLWSGRANIQYGRKWPVWTPPAEMIQRRPELARTQRDPA